MSGYSWHDVERWLAALELSLMIDPGPSYLDDAPESIKAELTKGWPTEEQLRDSAQHALSVLADKQAVIADRQRKVASKPRNSRRNAKLQKTVLGIWLKNTEQTAGQLCKKLELTMKKPPTLRTVQRIINTSRKHDT